jgi:hypothetical protein
MPSTTVRIDRQSYASLQELASSAGETMQSILERAIKEYQAKRFWEEMDSAYRSLQADPAAWKEECNERRIWDATLMDGLDADERWTEDGNAAR